MFILIECFDPGFPCIALDTQGIPLIFETREEAEAAAMDLQEPEIVEI